MDFPLTKQKQVIFSKSYVLPHVQILRPHRVFPRGYATPSRSSQRSLPEKSSPKSAAETTWHRRTECNMSHFGRQMVKLVFFRHSEVSSNRSTSKPDLVAPHPQECFFFLGVISINIINGLEKINIQNHHSKNI